MTFQEVTNDRAAILRLAIPTGRLQARVLELLRAAGIPVQIEPRSYRPWMPQARMAAKCLKPQSIPALIALGSRDIGFCGADWAYESGGALIELLDTGLQPVRIVAAAPEALLEGGRLPDRPLIVASEYERWPRAWIAKMGLNAALIATRGATEALPPDDADIIVDNTSSGETLRANGLQIIDTLCVSTTRLYASPAAMADPEKRALILTLCGQLSQALNRPMTGAVGEA